MHPYLIFGQLLTNICLLTIPDRKSATQKIRKEGDA